MNLSISEPAVVEIHELVEDCLELGRRHAVKRSDREAHEIGDGGVHVENPFVDLVGRSGAVNLFQHQPSASPVSLDRLAQPLGENPRLLRMAAAFTRHRSTSRLIEEILSIIHENTSTSTQTQAGFPDTEYAYNAGRKQHHLKNDLVLAGPPLIQRNLPVRACTLREYEPSFRASGVYNRSVPFFLSV